MQMNELGTLVRKGNRVFRCVKADKEDYRRCDHCDLTNENCSEIFDKAFGETRKTCYQGYKYELVSTDPDYKLSISDEIEPIISKLEYLKFRVDEVQKWGNKRVKDKIDSLKENNYYFETEEELKKYVESNTDLMDDIVKDNYIEKNGNFIVYENMEQIMNDDDTVKAILDEIFNRSR